jgi:hypothetical protein
VAVKPLRPEEEWARGIIGRTLAVAVEQHDDNSENRMHDLWIRYTHAPPAAVEVTTAADRHSIKLQKLVTPRTPLIVDLLNSNWLVYLDPAVDGGNWRIDALPRFVAELEGAGQRRLDVEPDDVVGTWETRARDLGIAHVSQIGIASPGTIHVLVDQVPGRSAGFVGDTGDPIAAWVGEFLRDERPDVLVKLADSQAPERHAFVLVPGIGFTTAPFAVTELLLRADLPLPLVEPQLPDEVTHVWIVPMRDERSGCYWRPDGGWLMVLTPPAPVAG